MYGEFFGGFIEFVSLVKIYVVGGVLFNCSNNDRYVNRVFKVLKWSKGDEKRGESI